MASEVPKQRLNDIASRKLHLLSVETSRSGDERLTGALSFSTGRVVNPVDSAPVKGAYFVVEGHDHLRFVEPPLNALPPVKFYDVVQISALEERILHALQRHAKTLALSAERLRALHCDVQLDAQRLAVVAVLAAAECRLELLGDGDGVRLHRVLWPNGRLALAPRSLPAVPLESFKDRADLELFLTDALVRAPSTRPGETEDSNSPQLVPVPSSGLTIGELQQIGADASLSPASRLEIVQDFQFGEERYRFIATHEAGTRFRGRIVGPKGEKWSEVIELSRFPSIAGLMALVLGVESRAGAPQGGAETAAVPQHLMPRAGEVWVMRVLVQARSSAEVRYVAINVGGAPYGAARVLAPQGFDEVFEARPDSWWMRVQVEGVRGGSVAYQQLDRKREARGPAKEIQTAVFISVFVPEEAAF